jgi:predicted Ser/Thr protein kinase
VIITDLFKKIIGKFDTIIFNPPYLPDDKLDNEKLITTGGKKGHEIIERFLKQASSHLELDGQILTVFSSLTGKKKMDEIIKKLNYQKFQLARQHVFMEDLYVYQIKKINHNIIKGHRGIVEIKENKKENNNVTVAIKRGLNKYYDAEKEARFLKILNKKGIGPKLIRHGNESITIEYIEGQRIIGYMQEKNKKEIIAVVKKILEQLITMDKLKINKSEMTNPYKHIIIRQGVPVMIDFERCHHSEKPQNITQFIQFLTSGKIMSILKQKNIHIDREDMLRAAKIYKNNQDTAALRLDPFMSS